MALRTLCEPARVHQAAPAGIAPLTPPLSLPSAPARGSQDCSWTVGGHQSNLPRSQVVTPRPSCWQRWIQSPGSCLTARPTSQGNPGSSSTALHTGVSGGRSWEAPKDRLIGKAAAEQVSPHSQCSGSSRKMHPGPQHRLQSRRRFPEREGPPGHAPAIPGNVHTVV